MEENFTWWSITETSAEFWEPLMLQMIFLIPSFFGTFILVLFLLAHVANLEKYMPSAMWAAPGSNPHGIESSENINDLFSQN
ncbi:hypothetical protein Y032_0245g3547 [Ancylostoma ceylanicum]|uniref:Uncharacterized protein n=1 Tax=Ancylostoma ceylanicum TaxID=53326 RepID=A0A016SDV6_9BILA|nr:hypothetical protein Y032_0245g3547 [Ancylostoma ceylanicum]